jgi:glutamyl-tRNA reductase
MSVQLHNEHEILPTAQALQVRAAAIRQGELKKAFGHLKRLSDAERQTVVALAAAITDGILSHPLQHLQGDPEGEFDVVVRDLFGLDGEAKPA